MKKILLWDMRQPRSNPARLEIDDAIASACVRAGVATAADPAEAGALGAGAAINPANPTEIVIWSGVAKHVRHVVVPSAVAALALAAGVAVLPGGAVPATFTPTPVKSWQIIGQYNDTGIGPQVTNSITVRALTTQRAKLAANNVTALRCYGQAHYVGGSGGLEIGVGNDIPTRAAALHGSNLLGISPSPVTVPNGSGATLVGEFTGLSLAAGDVLDLQKERVLTSGQQSVQTIPYAAGTLPPGVGRRADDGSGASALGTANPSGLSAGTLEGGIWLAYGEHPTYTFGVLADSIYYNNTDAALGDGGLIGAEGRTAEGGGMLRRGFRAAALATGIETPLIMMGRPSAQLSVYRANNTARRQKYPFFNTLILQAFTNDFDTSGGNKTVEQMRVISEAEAADYIAAYESGPNGGIIPCRVLIALPLPRGANVGALTTTQQRISDFVGLVKAGGVANIAGYYDVNSVFSIPGEPGRIANPAQFNADLVHPAPLGHADGSAYYSAMLQQPVPWMPL